MQINLESPDQPDAITRIAEPDACQGTQCPAASPPAPLLFFITLSYVRPLDQVDRHLAAHRAFLDVQYAQGTFLLSGPRAPRTGGVILARAASLDELHRQLATDPFKQHGIAEYDIVAFHARASAPQLQYLIAG